MKILDRLGVDLGAVGHHVVALQQKLRQHAHAAAHLQHRIWLGSCSARQRIAYLAGYVEIGQEMLTQRLFGSYFGQINRYKSVGNLAEELDAHQSYLLLGVLRAELLYRIVERIALRVLLKI